MSRNYLSLWACLLGFPVAMLFLVIKNFGAVLEMVMKSADFITIMASVLLLCLSVLAMVYPEDFVGEDNGEVREIVPAPETKQVEDE